MATNSSSMEEFCGSEFWNKSLVWETDDPDLTQCFQRTILIWIPCLFLWLLSPLELYYIRNSPNKNIPWSWINLSKLLFTVVLIVLTFVDIGMAINFQTTEDIFPVHFYTPSIKIATFVFAAALVYFNKVNGLRTSGLLFLFWFFFVIFSIPQARTEIRFDDQLEFASSWVKYQHFSFLVFFAVSIVILLVNCFADKEPLESIHPKTKNPCPETAASFLSRIFFAWFDSLAWRGFRNPLESKDLWQMKPEDLSSHVHQSFSHYWSISRAKRIIPKEPTVDATYSKNAASVSFNRPPPKKPASILPAICKAFGGTFVFGAMLKFIQDLLTFVSPQILRLIIIFIKDQEEPLWKGISYAVLLFAVAGVQTLVLAQYFNRMFLVGLRVRTALISAIYRKAMIMSNSARKESTVGEIVNLMAVDAQRFMDLTAYINMLWSAPLQIGLALFFLWELLGPSVLAGLAVMIILIPVNGIIANKIKTLTIRQMKNKDERVKLMNEILSGIKVLKLYAWEPSFEEQVFKIREKEIHVLKQTAYLNAGTSFIWSCAPFLVALVTFATFVLVDERNQLNATTAFVSLSLFNILRFPLSMLPMLISNMVQTSVSIKRINKFMNAEELDPDNVHHDEKEKNSLLIENGTFSWGDEDVILRDINMKVERENLVAVVGSVGSGKSSLISAYLGEMDKIKGRVNTNGSIAYVSQQAWIQNATLRDNITFGKPFDKQMYNRVVEACALKPDIEMLPGGDQTEIGEKGINLSGGQKQRVSLARAVYNNADVYFLDDPLSAVDSHVGKHIFEQVIGPSGMLAKKARILVTHGITYLPKTDFIYVLKDGSISESGNYTELLDKKGAFAEFLIQHIQEINPEEEDLDEIKLQLETTISSEELRQKLERAISRTRGDSQSEDTAKIPSEHSLSRQSSVDNSGDGNLLRRRKSDKSNSQLNINAQEEAKEKLIEQEKAETGSVKWDVYKHYLKSIGIALSLATILLNIVFQGFSIGSNIWLSKWSTDPDANQTNTRNMYLSVYGAFGIGQGIANLASAFIMSLGCLYAAREMHVILLTNVLRWPMEVFDITPLGRVLNRFSKDVDVLDNTLPLSVRSCMAMLFSVIATLVVICISSPMFAAVIIPIGGLYYFVQRFYVATSRQLKRLESVSRSPIYSHFSESLTGAQTIRAYQVQDRFVTESEDKVDYNQVCYYPSIIANRWLAVRLEMVGNLIILFASLFAVLGRDDGVNAGLVGLSVTYALQITQTLNWLVRMTSDVETNIVAVERIKEYGETKQEAPWELPNVTVPISWPELGRVEFNNFQVRYREGLELVLRGITFVVQGGEKVGIVGRTGAGKSSLTLALFRIVEAAEGTIIIDGLDIAKLGLHALRSRLTIIPQDPVLFSGTLRINLDPFNAHSDDEVWRALTLAHLKTFVKGLTAGLSHEVSEGGENLSVGQRQLICLARALLRKTKVLILDEATAAVDLETDDLIQNTIRTEFKECTVLTIAHRLNTIMDSDRVLVLDKGTVVEYSQPQELLQNKKSIFYGMAKDAGLV